METIEPMKLWIRLDVSIRSDPNVSELAERLNIPFAEAVGLCTLVWCAIAEHRPSGDITGLSISTLEKWAGYEPRKGKRSGAFAAAFLELFASEGEASGWHHRQGALIDRAEKEKARKRRGKRAAVPQKVAPTERNGTEQRTTTRSFSPQVWEKLPEEFRADYEDLALRLSGNGEVAWSAELLALAEGIRGKAPTWEQIGQAIRDYNANDEKPNLVHFRGYVRRATAGPRTDYSSSGAHPRSRRNAGEESIRNLLGVEGL